MTRRSMQTAIVVLLLTLAGSHSPHAQSPDRKTPPAVMKAFDFAALQRLARERASHAYEDLSPPLQPSLAKLNYDQYRDIRFRPQQALWHGRTPFEVHFFHRGAFFQRRVNIYEVSGGVAKLIPYSAAAFDLSRVALTPADVPASTGFAGFRVHYPLNTPTYKDELAVFLGASYFKILGRGQHYGISARGLAVDTAGPRGEEFPEFTDFWLMRPQAKASQLTVYALLDSRSITGAYRFVIKPGENTEVQVSAQLYPRRAIDKLGIAPLTSMFLYGENVISKRFEDFRPEVHDSDGLQAHTGKGEWLWRALANPRDLRISRFVDESPNGFGLIQRDRDFDHYQDNEARYEQRPSYWVKPTSKWGKGSVELVEIPTDEEINDNIVAYWVPEAPVQADKPLSFSYVLSAESKTLTQSPQGRVIATRMSRLLGPPPKPDVEPDPTRRVILDFAGGELDKLEKTRPVVAALSGTNAEIRDITVEKLSARDIWRVAFQVKPKGKEPVDMRCLLTLDSKPLTETWLHLWTP